MSSKGLASAAGAEGAGAELLIWMDDEPDNTEAARPDQGQVQSRQWEMMGGRRCDCPWQGPDELDPPTELIPPFFLSVEAETPIAERG